MVLLSITNEQQIKMKKPLIHIHYSDYTTDYTKCTEYCCTTVRATVVIHSPSSLNAYECFRSHSHMTQTHGHHRSHYTEVRNPYAFVPMITD